VTQTVAIIDYGSGNLRSAEKAFERSAKDHDADIVVTNDPDIVRDADRIVLPGVGAFADCMAGLNAVPGMTDVLKERVIANGVPFFGICVGMQLMATLGREKGEHQGLGWIGGAIEKIVPDDKALKVPHMGWNTLTAQTDHVLFDAIAMGPDGLHAYFVHSYHFVADDPLTVLATAEYGGQITAAIGRDNLFGTQFHPEKSQTLGLALIGNFLKWKP
jgi:imidazole glycerol-phosphate synthase subunit HisH